MFRAVNTESENERRKSNFERQKIINTYFSTIKTLKLEKFFALNVCYEQNQGLYDNGKSNLLYNYVSRSSYDIILQNIDKYGILEYKSPFFEFIRKSIDNGYYIRAQKLLNIAAKKNWATNEYFALKDKLYSVYFNVEKIDVTKPLKLENREI